MLMLVCKRIVLLTAVASVEKKEKQGDRHTHASMASRSEASFETEYGNQPLQVPKQSSRGIVTKIGGSFFAPIKNGLWPAIRSNNGKEHTSLNAEARVGKTLTKHLRSRQTDVIPKY